MKNHPAGAPRLRPGLARDAGSCCLPVAWVPHWGFLSLRDLSVSLRSLVLKSFEGETTRQTGLGQQGTSVLRSRQGRARGKLEGQSPVRSTGPAGQ